MSVELTVGGVTFVYPSENQSPGYGEDATGWAEKITEITNTLFPLGSILLTSDTILGNGILTDIKEFRFDSGIVSAFRAHYHVERTSSGTETGIVDGLFDGGSWDFHVEPLGDASIEISMHSSGQMQYQTKDGIDGGVIKFKTISVISA